MCEICEVNVSLMRMLAKLVECEGAELVGTHCIVEWDEESQPCSIIERKYVINLTGIGEMCSMKINKKSKAVVL